MSIDLKAHGLRVKPLEWRDFSLCSFSGHYTASKNSDERYEIFDLNGTRRLSPMACDTIDEAKAACQAHHESQVLALLESIEGGQ